MAAGVDYTCGLTTANAAYCWGVNFYGRLGDGSTNAHLTPAAVAGGHQFDTITLLGNHTCALTTGSHNAYCWGLNVWGQLGNGTMANSSIPVVVVSPM
jgi:alpha-tubulin suppressor-like RCC1 family protein